ncbi:MAG: helix-turn-helix domain-containing protein, partial [Lewinella sp.]|nr:helix-turn-helix domain-containing protein [Lewinella sp.]
LLSNAIKYSPEGGKVIFHISREGEELVVKVRDNGLGIPAAELPHIFDRFYRGRREVLEAAEGTGIGLALVKEWVDLMDGELLVKSKEGKGSTFIVRLPIRREAPINTAPAVAMPLEMGALEEDRFEEPEMGHGDALPTLLLVEDNADVLNFLQSSLRDQYQLMIARDGAEGLALALEHIPDLILSDVLMPQLSGFDLCKSLKRNEKTSHIPIILLTAKVDERARLKGLHQGADAYLSKPFSLQELKVRLRQLLLLRQRLQERYQKARPFGQWEPAASTQEDAFMHKLQVQLETHLGDETFGVQELARAMGMSRSQVFKKVKALTGLSIARYVRQYRVHRARKLLEETSLSVSEVAYAVGFKDPAYFSRVFSEVFGQPPSDTRK